MAAHESPQTTGSEDEAPAPARFDESLAELETLVEHLEQGDLSLEESLARFERGVALARQCQEQLNAAEQKVQQLLARDDGEDLTEYNDDSTAPP